MIGRSSPANLDGVTPRDLSGITIGGYALEDLAGKVTFEAAAHLLWLGHLPTPAETASLSREIAELRPLPDATTGIVREAARRGAARDGFRAVFFTGLVFAGFFFALAMGASRQHRAE